MPKQELDDDVQQFIAVFNRLADLAERYVVAFEQSMAHAKQAMDVQMEQLAALRKDME